MKKLLALLCALLMILTVAGCNSTEEAGGSTGGQEEVSYAEKAENAQNEILASIEPDYSVTGTLVIYSPNSNGELNAIRPGFLAKYPKVDLQIVSMKTGEVLTKIQAEAENPTIDLMWGGMNYEKWANNQTSDATGESLWLEYVSPNEANIKVESAKNTTGYFTCYGLSGNTAFIINVPELEKLGLKVEDITGYQSLVDNVDKLKGHVLHGDSVSSSSAWQELVVMLYLFGGGHDSKYDDLNMDDAWAFVEKFIEVIDGVGQSSSSAVYKNVIQGEAAIGVTYEDPALQAVKDEVEGITMIYPVEGNNWTPCAVAIVNNCPNPDLAKKFVDFVISEEGQKLYACTTLRTVTGEPNIVPNFLEFEKIPNVFEQDQVYIATKTDEWKAKYTSLIDAYNAKKK